MSGLSPLAAAIAPEHIDHHKLVLEEPLLCTTIVMISSRYHVLQGSGGMSRANFIHMRLWKYCVGLDLPFGAVHVAVHHEA